MLRLSVMMTRRQDEEQEEVKSCLNFKIKIPVEFISPQKYPGRFVCRRCGVVSSPPEPTSSPGRSVKLCVNYFLVLWPVVFFPPNVLLVKRHQIKKVMFPFSAFLNSKSFLNFNSDVVAHHVLSQSQWELCHLPRKTFVNTHVLLTLAQLLPRCHDDTAGTSSAVSLCVCVCVCTSSIFTQWDISQLQSTVSGSEFSIEIKKECWLRLYVSVWWHHQLLLRSCDQILIKANVFKQK